nr:MAG TPA: hypothetical protein [Caudoviricetes sp.]DAT33073.1 MAG TPA: hypothetical protein [Caudoviricetes sp.]
MKSKNLQVITKVKVWGFFYSQNILNLSSFGDRNFDG